MDIGERAKTAAPNTGAEGEPTLGALNSQFAALLSQLELLPEASLLQRCRVWTGALAAVEARCLASRVDSDGDTRAAARAAEQTGGVSRAAARRKARRARAVKNNPGLADMAASGRLSGEQLDTIADAAESDDARRTTRTSSTTS